MPQNKADTFLGCHAYTQVNTGDKQLSSIHRQPTLTWFCAVTNWTSTISSSLSSFSMLVADAPGLNTKPVTYTPPTSSPRTALTDQTDGVWQSMVALSHLSPRSTVSIGHPFTRHPCPSHSYLAEQCLCRHLLSCNHEPSLHIRPRGHACLAMGGSTCALGSMQSPSWKFALAGHCS